MALVVLFLCATLFTAICAYTDLRAREIPNRVIAIALLVAVPLHATVRYLLSGNSGPGELLTAFGYSLAGLVVCGLGPLVLFQMRAMGGGDVKLLATVGAFLGPMIGIEIELYAFVLLALYAGAQLAYRGVLLRSLGSSLSLLANPLVPKARRRAVPQELLTELSFAPAVFAATLLLCGLHVGFAQFELP